MADVIAFVAADAFQSKFENFFLKHAQEFGDDEEHKLVYHDIYLEFQSMFDDELEYFCELKGLSRSEFYRKCKSASEADPKAMHYIQILLSSAEYETFVRLMKIMKPIAKMKNEMKSDAKEPSGGDIGGKTAKGLEEDEGEELEDFSRADEKDDVDLRRGAKGEDDDLDMDFGDKDSKK